MQRPCRVLDPAAPSVTTARRGRAALAAVAVDARWLSAFAAELGNDRMPDPRLVPTGEYFDRSAVSSAPDPPAAAAPLTRDRKSETQRAYREARTAIALLQQRWPAAFPEGPQQVRPLITGLTPLIVAALGWSPSLTPVPCCALGSCAPPIAAPFSTILSALTWMATQPTRGLSRDWG